ncbi:Protein CHROMATIN REMODELING 24 [Sarracenia purpurea var. burkii]
MAFFLSGKKIIENIIRFEQILKKICDHPLLLTKRAAEDVLEGMDSMLKQEDNDVAEKLAMHIADVTERSDIEENHEDNLISEGHYVLIFSQTRKMLNLIQESLVGKGYKFLRIDGTTKAGDRVKIVDDFQEGTGGPIFLLTSQVGGLGLTLTRADRVIVVDPAWNPSPLMDSSLVLQSHDSEYDECGPVLHQSNVYESDRGGGALEQNFVSSGYCGLVHREERVD